MFTTRFLIAERMLVTLRKQSTGLFNFTQSMTLFYQQFIINVPSFHNLMLGLSEES